MSRYSTPDEARRWARIRELLTAGEAALLFNALQDKARGDREAVEISEPDGEVGAVLRATLRDQANLADDMADMVLS